MLWYSTAENGAFAKSAANEPASEPVPVTEAIATFSIEEDTTREFNPFLVISLTNSSRKVQQEEKTLQLYKKLKNVFYQTPLTKKLFDLLFIPPSGPKPKPTDQINPIARYERHDQKVIGNINIKKLELFGPTVTDTSKNPKSWVQKALNTIHTPTRSRVIRKNLLIEKGEPVNPQLLADSERLLRELSFIRDARVHLVPRNDGSDTVDVLVLTQDVLAYSAGGDYSSPERFSLTLRNNNIGGTGHELRNEVTYDVIQQPSVGYWGTYYIPNIGGKFINSRFDYAHSDFLKTIGGQIERNFYTPGVRWAGGLQFNRSTFKRGLLFINPTRDSLFHYRFDYTNAWVAHAFRLWKRKGKYILQDERSRIVVGARFSRRDYHLRPDLTPSDLNFFHDNRLYLASIGWSKRRYIRDYYLFGFGRTEDIPHGGLVNLTFGIEDQEFNDYNYAGINLARGRYFWQLGYLYAQIGLSSYFHQSTGRMDRRQLHLSTNYYSPLWTSGKYSFRHILSVDYLYGDRRYEHEFLYIRPENVRGLGTLEQRGTQRFSIRFETVSFTPLYFLGFQFAGFAFADLSLLNVEPKISLKGQDFQGYGLGIRVRNENLTFNTFQLRFSIYPDSPLRNFGISISTIPSKIFDDFKIGEPRPLEFR